eukprot:c525_g1_i1.p1 GENE.c525_g1_i1~~c525_g1_i1.p1  ORF type:complete len:133 (-),score=14.55 c525_g1_i1:81-479(-)
MRSLVVALLFCVGAVLAGQCIDKNTELVTCNGKPASDYDKLCVSDSYSYTCMNCHPSWLVECDCDNCSVKAKPGAVAGFLVLVLVIIALGITCCCRFCACCPWYQAVERRRVMTHSTYVAAPSNVIAIPLKQ